MPVSPGRGRQEEARLRRQEVLPLVLASALGCAMLAGRIYLTHTLGYAHMVWNVFLAWLPYLFSRWALRISRRCPGRLLPLLVPGLLWLVFLPNAPYLLTEFVHLQEIPAHAPWYDAALLVAFAWAGCFLAVRSIDVMHAIAARFVGRAAGWLFVVTTAVLAGLGVYLGRYLRWNSWDLFVEPQHIAADITARVSRPLDHPRTYGMTFFFAAFLLVCYLADTRPRSGGEQVL